MSQSDLNKCQPGPLPSSGDKVSTGVWDVGSCAWLSKPGAGAASPETPACGEGFGKMQNRTRLQKYICRQGLFHPASSARHSSWAMH